MARVKPVFKPIRVWAPAPLPDITIVMIAQSCLEHLESGLSAPYTL